jgi:GxxExxY protein
MEHEDLTRKIITAAIEVHKVLGPGMLESSYEECMFYELHQQNLTVERQKPVPVEYKNIKLNCGYRIDLLIEKKIIIELKSVDTLAKIHEAQILTYMRFAGIKVGLLINFNVTVLKNGIRRFIL